MVVRAVAESFFYGWLAVVPTVLSPLFFPLRLLLLTVDFAHKYLRWKLRPSKAGAPHKYITQGNVTELRHGNYFFGDEELDGSAVNNRTSG